MSHQTFVPRIRIQNESIQGGRDYQEDFAKCVELPGGRIAIILCDGHGGSACSQYVLRSMIKELKQLKLDDWDIAPCIQRISQRWNRKCLKVLGTKIWPQTEKERRYLFAQAPHRYFTEQWYSGTTLVVCLLDPVLRKGIMVNLGDSRGIWKDLDKTRSRLRSTRDHVPYADDLGPLGGEIITEVNDVPRINGDLAVGRAIGDNTAELLGTVKDKPTIKEITWGKGHRFRVVVASDGVWDVVSNSHAIRATSAADLIDVAVKRNSTDNITAVHLEIDYVNRDYVLFSSESCS